MEVILLKDVETLGEQWDEVKVSDGYARNFLLPRNLAIAATPEALESNKQRLLKRQQQRAREKEAALALAKQLGQLEAHIKAEAGEEGKLFGSVTSQHVVDKIKELAGVEIDKKKVHLEHPIKTLGTHKVSIKVYPEVSATLTLHVEAQ
jgi:large subunit ribosomal protein L9